MKPLKPSNREKKRYLKVKGSIGDIEKAIFEGIGTIGMSKVGLAWIKKSKESSIISINRETIDAVRACFALWSKKIDVLKVSGTLKGLGK